MEAKKTMAYERMALINNRDQHLGAVQPGLMSEDAR
jgi:hypothetical protein